MIWDEAAIDRLKELLAKGLSMSQVAAELGCSRNSIVGKVHRLGLCRFSKPSAPKTARPSIKPKAKLIHAATAPKPAKPSVPAKQGMIAPIFEEPPAVRAAKPPSKSRALARPTETTTRTTNHGNRFDLVEVTKPDPLPASSVEDTGIPIAQRCTLLQLTDSTCRWPVGTPGTNDFFFCGAPDAENSIGEPYCRHHARRAATGAGLRITEEERDRRRALGRRMAAANRKAAA